MVNSTSTKIFVGLAWFVAVYHFILGLIGTFAPGNLVVSVTSQVFGITPDPTAQFFYMSKFVAAYFILFAVMMAFVASNPQKYGKLAWAAVILFGVRIFDRVVFFNLLNDAFGVTMARNMVTVIPIMLIAIGLIICMPKEKR